MAKKKLSVDDRLQLAAAAKRQKAPKIVSQSGKDKNGFYSTMVTEWFPSSRLKGGNFAWPEELDADIVAINFEHKGKGKNRKSRAILELEPPDYMDDSPPPQTGRFKGM